MKDSELANNEAVDATLLAHGSDLRMERSTVAANRNEAGPAVRGIDCGDVSIDSSIVGHNGAWDAPSGSQALVVVVDAATTEMSRSCLYGLATAADVEQDVWHADPKFESDYFQPDFDKPLSMDLRLDRFSPCVDHGYELDDWSPSEALPTDVAGRRRWVASAPDAGAHEYFERRRVLSTDASSVCDTTWNDLSLPAYDQVSQSLDEVLQETQNNDHIAEVWLAAGDWKDGVGSAAHMLFIRGSRCLAGSPVVKRPPRSELHPLLRRHSGRMTAALCCG